MSITDQKYRKTEQAQMKVLGHLVKDITSDCQMNIQISVMEKSIDRNELFSFFPDNQMIVNVDSDIGFHRISFKIPQSQFWFCYS